MTETLPDKTHNGGPEIDDRTELEKLQERVNDLYEEGKLWLDGQKVKTEDQASALNTFEDSVRKLIKECEAQAKIDKEPHQTKLSKIQADYNQLIGNTKFVTGKLVSLLSTTKAALKPYLLELDRKQREAEEAARKEAEEAERIAREAMQSRQADNLEQREEAERLVHEAEAAKKAASKAAKAKAHAKGSGRATALRTVWKAELVDESEAAKWAWNNKRAEIMALIVDLANKEAKQYKRPIAGFNVYEDKEL